MVKDSIKPIKKLGQNFLRDENILRRIADAALINSNDIILEIGTGAGNLTRYLCERAKFVYTVEKDARVCKIAEENLKEFKNIKIICDDILCVIGSLAEFASSGREEFPRAGGRIKIIGNIPYYITTPIIFKLLKQRKYIEDIIIMTQKEVAERIVAKPGGPHAGRGKDCGILSHSAQFYTKPEILFFIKKGAFRPQPKVDSALLRLKPLEKPLVTVKSEDGFLNIIKAAFGQRRKTLLNSLSGGLKLKREEIENVLRKAEIDPKRRAETLSPQEFARISNFLL